MKVFRIRKTKNREKTGAKEDREKKKKIETWGEREFGGRRGLKQTTQKRPGASFHDDLDLTPRRTKWSFAATDLILALFQGNRSSLADIHMQPALE
jgi:hypothetical protein